MTASKKWKKVVAYPDNYQNCRHDGQDNSDATNKDKKISFIHNINKNKYNFMKNMYFTSSDIHSLYFSLIELLYQYLYETFHILNVIMYSLAISIKAAVLTETS